MGRYKNTKKSTSKISNIRRSVFEKYQTTIYDKVPERNDDLLLISQEGDRLDNLAFQFYGDSSLWWYIAKANDLKTMNIPAGTSFRIPNVSVNAKGS